MEEPEGSGNQQERSQAGLPPDFPEAKGKFSQPGLKFRGRLERRLGNADCEEGSDQLIIDVVDSMRTIAFSHQCELVVNLPKSSQVVAIDANLMSRALGNLISNAIKYSPPNAIITVELQYLGTVSSELSPHIQIRTLDQGYGMSEEQRQTIFDKFSIGDAVKGLTQVGLGLAFCKLVVEAHLGKIFVEANHPKGSIFTVII